MVANVLEELAARSGLGAALGKTLSGIQLRILVGRIQDLSSDSVICASSTGLRVLAVAKLAPIWMAM